MICFPIRGTDVCVLDGLGRLRGWWQKEGLHDLGGVLLEAWPCFLLKSCEMSWTHSGRAARPVPGPRPLPRPVCLKPPLPPGRVSPQPPPFLLCHNLPESVCTDDPGSPAPGHQPAWLPGRTAGPGANWSAPRLCCEPPPSFLSALCLKFTALLVFCWDSFSNLS